MTVVELLQNKVAIGAMKLAWYESAPGISSGHEEGGFILRSPSGEISVQRWAIGTQNQIFVPLHQNCRIGVNDILASFHTHPNTGSNFLQEPKVKSI